MLSEHKSHDLSRSHLKFLLHELQSRCQNNKTVFQQYNKRNEGSDVTCVDKDDTCALSTQMPLLQLCHDHSQKGTKKFDLLFVTTICQVLLLMRVQVFVQRVTLEKKRKQNKGKKKGVTSARFDSPHVCCCHFRIFVRDIKQHPLLLQKTKKPPKKKNPPIKAIQQQQQPLSLTQAKRTKLYAKLMSIAGDRVWLLLGIDMSPQERVRWTKSFLLVAHTMRSRLELPSVLRCIPPLHFQMPLSCQTR